MTIVVSRYMPIIRTFAPFVAGVGAMHYGRFQLFNVIGGASWVLIFIWGGYLFGNIPIIKENFGIVTIAIIVVSVLPAVIAFLRRKKAEPDAAA
jgi:membrane-associated protein